MSKLVEGFIPANTLCPFRECVLWDQCSHKGVDHLVEFSCALARGFDMIGQPNETEEKDV